MKFNWKSAIGIALSVALLVWTLRGVSLGAVWLELERSNLWLFLAAAVAATLIFPLRAIRWRVSAQQGAGTNERATIAITKEHPLHQGRLEVDRDAAGAAAKP